MIRCCPKCKRKGLESLIWWEATVKHGKWKWSRDEMTITLWVQREMQPDVEWHRMREMFKDHYQSVKLLVRR